MTTPADDTTAERAFEALLAGRSAPGDALALAAFTAAVRGSASGPGRPNAALAELLATGLTTDQLAPSPRTDSRKRPRMLLSTLVAKLAAAGVVAKAATGTAVVAVALTGTTTVVVAVTDDGTTPPAVSTTADETTSPPAPPTAGSGDPSVPPTGDATSVPVPSEAPDEPLDLATWEQGPAPDQSFGDWVSAGAHSDLVRAGLQGNFGSYVREHARKKGLDDADLAAEGVDLADLDGFTDGTAAPEPEVTEAPAGTPDVAAGTTAGDRGDRGRNGSGGGHGNAGGNGNAGGSGNGGGTGTGNGRN